MANDVLSALPARQGHFRLESGLHTDLWLTLDALFLSPRELAPLVTALANRLRPFGASAVCGPLLGGAFLAQALATELGVRFYYSEPIPSSASSGLFAAEYRIPQEMQKRLHGEQVALVDDVISAGSSVRATAQGLRTGGATIAVVGTFLALGTLAIDHFAGLEIPFEALERQQLSTWNPRECPLCQAGVPLEDPLAASDAAASNSKR
jgi:orotate phosphoribosyltransferase